jgi:DNA repair photolyase
VIARAHGQDRGWVAISLDLNRRAGTLSVVGPRPLSNPPNPWASTVVQYLEGPPEARIEVFEDHTKGILATNTSPDIPFRYSVNPYRGCMHACAYCYARPGHEYLSFGAGTDFDTKIVVKPHAPALLREAFEKPSWKGELVAFSGVTDCYQPLEASYGLTRACLKVCAEYRNPCCVVTKAPLIERDLDVLTELNRVTRVRVTVSVPIWNPETARAIEPYVATPLRRIRTIEALSRAGILVGVNIAPIIPGLNDRDLAELMTAARAAGAKWANYILLRLPGSVAAVFEERLRAKLPLAADRVLHRIRETRGGKLYDSRWKQRHVGEGEYAETIGNLFQALSAKLGYAEWPDDDPWPTTFRRPGPPGQLSLFG